MKKALIFSLTILLLSSCFGDKKSVVGTDFNDTSFVNKNFKANKIEFSKITNPCNYISKSTLATLYKVTEEDVLLVGGNNSKSCTIRVKLSGAEFDFITGGIRFYEERDKQEDGSSWVDSWQLQKNISKSSIWIPNLGKAAYYKANKRELKVKLNNYTLVFTAPGSAFNQVEKALKRDYKKIALEMVKETNILN